MDVGCGWKRASFGEVARRFGALGKTGLAKDLAESQKQQSSESTFKRVTSEDYEGTITLEILYH